MQWANQITYGFQQLPTMHRNIFWDISAKARALQTPQRITPATMPFQLQKCQKNYTCLLHSLPLPFFMLVDHFLEQLCFFFGNFLSSKKCCDKPWRDPSNVRSTKYRDSSACTWFLLELKQKPLHPHWQCILFHTFSVQPYKSWIFSSQAVPDITLQVPRS